ncbi:hypothetical protein MAR_020320 [Mya arenaria]|uniref:Uncharacterized protein n=1 Tax=Mya arenaria TaxID=6604 RepID=A0ABY7E8N4_MYAAR|nr:hypothetical protein MAR_020320 [Mya arenaria]
MCRSEDRTLLIQFVTINGNNLKNENIQVEDITSHLTIYINTHLLTGAPTANEQKMTKCSVDIKMSAEEVGIDDQLERFNNDLVVNNVPVIIFIAVVCTIGIAGNSVAFAFYRTRMSRSVNTLFLTVLSLNDLLTSFILLDIR